MKMSLRLTLAVSFALLFIWLLFNQCDKSYGYGIVNNSGTSSEDSLNIAIPCLDSLGRPTACDTFLVLVFKSGTNTVVFRDSGTTAMTGLDTVMIKGRTFYYYHRAVADIDGGGAIGQYAIKIISITAVADLPTEINKEFQITNAELSDALDSAGLGAIHAVNIDDDSLGGIKNKIYSYLNESISGIDDDPWDNAVRSLTATGLDADTSFANLQTVSAGIKAKTDLLTFSTGDSLTKIDKSDLWGFGVTVNDKTGFTLAPNGLGADTSFTNLQTVSAGIKAKTDKLTFNAQDSLIVDYSNIPTGGLTPAEHDTLFKIRNYSYAVEETIRVHAPHGNDWGQGGGGDGGTDTALIKIMNNNNSWGAYYTWNYTTRTLTSGAGSGANSVVIRCKQSSDSTNIAGAQIQVLDSIQNSTIGLLNSDSQGRAFFALNNGVYCVRIHKPGWQFTVPETLRVSGNKDTTYYAGAYSPGSPPLPILCRVYGWIYDINNQPVVGAKIEASIKTIPLRYENVIISPYYKSTTTDDEGYWYLDLYPNSVLSPYDTKYIFFIYSPSGTILRIETTVPNQTSWELQW